MTAEQLLTALHLPPGSAVGKRVPKKLLLESTSPTAADKRLIAEGIEDIHWLASLKPALLGVPAFHDATRDYREIAILRLTLRAEAKATRVQELLHRAVPHPLWLISVDAGVSVSLAHKRHALNEAGKTVLDGSVVSASVDAVPESLQHAFLQVLPVALQPRASLWACYQGWLDALLALQAARHTGHFRLSDSEEHASARRDALQRLDALQARIAQLRSAADKASQLARQVELNLDVQRLQVELSAARAQL